MEPKRKPLEGVWNIIRFNWHFYVLSSVFFIGLIVFRNLSADRFQAFFDILLIITTLPVVVSLLVSMYVYDLSGLYDLTWLNGLQLDKSSCMLNINAGFDEMSHALQNKFRNSSLTVFDFYDPSKHTEISILRARKAYPPYPGTINVNTTQLPLPDACMDAVFTLFAAHEIRNEKERIVFFSELNRILKPDGCLVVTEHSRDFPNFLAYTIGFFHFHTKSSWKRVFKEAGLGIDRTISNTPFVTTYFLKKNGIAA